jgi:hypothetical protein
MLAAERGFGRWDFVLGNVLMAFGAPVFVTSLVSVVTGHRARGAQGEDVFAIVAGAVFICVGLVVTVLAGRGRRGQTLARGARHDFIAINEYRQGDSNGLRRSGGDTDGTGVIGRLDLNLGTLDDYYTRPGGSLALADSDPYDDRYWYDEQATETGEQPARGRASVPPQRHPTTGFRPPARNTREWSAADRFCEPSTTATRSTGSRRRPPAG